jgi:hypothetical protein
MTATATNRNSVLLTTNGLVRPTIHDKAVGYTISKMLKEQNAGCTGFVQKLGIYHDKQSKTTTHTHKNKV